MHDIVLDIQGLSRRYGALAAVDNVPLTANSGEIFGLLGSNGAGKTTMIKMLARLLPPTSGDARVAGISITKQAVDVRRSIGYVQQAVSVDGSLTGYENLLIFAKRYALPRRDQKGRIYAESFRGPDILRHILEQAKQTVSDLFASASLPPQQQTVSEAKEAWRNEGNPN
jgi:ABC-type multidrug transport system ATPase subunit